MNKFIFIDESGDPGFGNKSPTTHFILSMLIFDSNEDMIIASRTLQNFKSTLNFKTEFKFTKSYKNLREKFFETIRVLNFRVKIVCVDKSKIKSEIFIKKPQEFYNFYLKELIKNTKDLNNLIIIIDGEAKRLLALELKAYLRKDNNINIKQLKFQCSKKEILLQMADMIASGIGYSFNRRDKIDSDKYYNYLKDKVDFLACH